MANAREIQSRMKSIQDTMKITNAMYMISSSKMKKARKSLVDTEPYFYTLQSTIIRILRHFPEMEHPYFGHKAGSDLPKKEPKIGYIVVTADKGLAGSYNHNVIKLAEAALDAHPDSTLFVVGELGRHAFARKTGHLEEHFEYTAQNPSMNRSRNIAERILQLYNSDQLDEVHVIYTKMLNSMQCETELVQLLPLKKADFSIKLPVGVPMEEIALSPNASAVMDALVPNYLSGMIYGALVESYSSEQNSRMMAMDAATTSAKKMLHELSIAYNRVRQAAITQEITEVIGGAKAQKKKKKA